MQFDIEIQTNFRRTTHLEFWGMYVFLCPFTSLSSFWNFFSLNNCTLRKERENILIINTKCKASAILCSEWPITCKQRTTGKGNVDLILNTINTKQTVHPVSLGATPWCSHSASYISLLGVIRKRSSKAYTSNKSNSTSIHKAYCLWLGACCFCKVCCIWWMHFSRL